MWTKILVAWDKLSPDTQQWLRGAELAVVTAIVAAFVASPAADFSTKKGIAEFAAGIASAGYGALRLYMTQKPVSLLVETKEETATVGDISTSMKTTTVTQQDAPNTFLSRATYVPDPVPTAQFITGMTVVPDSFKPASVPELGLKLPDGELANAALHRATFDKLTTEFEKPVTHPDLKPTAVSSPRIGKL